MSNPTGYLLVNDEFTYVGSRVPRQIGEGAVTIDAVTIHNINADDVGRCARGLIYWKPSDTKRRGGYMVCVGGDGNTLHFPNIDGVTALRDYLTAIINNNNEEQS